MKLLRTYASVDSNSDDNLCIFLYYMREVLNVGYREKRSQARELRFPPDIDDWLISQKERRNCSFDDLMIEAVQLFLRPFRPFFQVRTTEEV